MTYKEYGDCVYCDHCIHCGRDKPYWIFECDICGRKFYDEDKVVKINGKDYCNRCYEEAFEETESA